MSTQCSQKVRKRKTITLEKKIKILNRLQKRQKPSLISKLYGLSESTIRTIKKMEDSIRSRVSSGPLPNSNGSSYTRNPVLETMEKSLIIWIEDSRQQNMPINSSTIRQKAVDIYNKLKEQSSSSDDHPNFSGSKGWFWKFKKRYSLHNLKLTVNKSSKASEQEGFDNNLKVNDANEILADHELTDNELIHMISETRSSNKYGESVTSITAENIYKALQLAADLESTILDIDPNVERALKFQHDLKNCCSEYHEISVKLTKNTFEHTLFDKRHAYNETKVEVVNISSEEDSNFEPIKKKMLALEYSSDSDNK